MRQIDERIKTFFMNKIVILEEEVNQSLNIFYKNQAKLEKSELIIASFKEVLGMLDENEDVLENLKTIKDSKLLIKTSEEDIIAKTRLIIKLKDDLDNL